MRTSKGLFLKLVASEDELWSLAIFRSMLKSRFHVFSLFDLPFVEVSLSEKQPRDITEYGRKKFQRARKRVIGCIRVLPLAIGNSPALRSHNCPEELLCSGGVLDVIKPSTWFESCSHLFPLMIQRYERSTDLEWCQTVSTALSSEDWEYDKGLCKAKGLCRLVCPSFKPYLTLAEMKKQGRTEM